MAFKKISKINSPSKDPESLFRDLRARTVEGLLAQQADMLREYIKHIEVQDIALELPTGSGKTLVGLLIAEWRRVSKQERCLILCPTKQLVNQVVEQAKEKYGISAISFTGSKKHYSEQDKTAFKNCEAIGVTTYSALFNINPFFDDVNVLIFDDAHSAENYVSKCWSLDINKYNEKELFNEILESVFDKLDDNYRRIFEKNQINQFDSTLVHKIPSHMLLQCQSELVSILESRLPSTNHRYTWEMIKEHIHALHFYYTSNSILIRPVIPPTEHFTPFQNVKQRIYMSATLGEGGDLERIFGRKKITRIPAPTGWDTQGIGRRFFIFPMRTLAEDDALKCAISWIKKFDRTLILTPSSSDAEKIGELAEKNFPNYTFVDASDFEDTKKYFTQEKKAIAILANRYDGIDLVGEECRYLILYGLPEALNLQERFIMSRLGASILFQGRIRTRITQAVGRCTRSSTDYALVVVIGDKTNQYFHNPDKRKTLHPELQSEVEFGIEQSKETNENEWSENIDIFINHGKDWAVADENIIELRNSLEQKPLCSAKNLACSVINEVKFCNALWAGDYESAVRYGKDILSQICGGTELKGYSALWNYLTSAAAFQSKDIDVAKQFMSYATSCTSYLPWLKTIRMDIDNRTSHEITDITNMERIEKIELLFETFGTFNSLKIERYLNEIREGLDSKSANLFEKSQILLGELLGFSTEKRKESGAPDPCWILDSRGIVFEDYTDTGKEPIISKRKTLQAKGHPDTLSSRYPTVKFSVVFCSTSEQLDSAAEPHASEIFYIHLDDYRNFAKNCIKIMRTLWNSFTEAGNLAWREKVVSTLNNEMLDNDALFKKLTSKKLSSLSKKK